MSTGYIWVQGIHQYWLYMSKCYEYSTGYTWVMVIIISMLVIQVIIWVLVIHKYWLYMSTVYVWILFILEKDIKW
jgi:hypothetical protein